MKKCDLHIHTISTASDSNFMFSIEALADYTSQMHIDVIAITNHNIFDPHQFRDIVTRLGNDITVFPGIEINLEGGHILLIASNNSSELDDFTSKCKQVSALIIDPTTQLSIEQFEKIFAPFSKYLLIPHYDKEPKLPRRIIDHLADNITVGEVTSVKKFLYMLKNTEEQLSPVLFSDYRPTDSGIPYPTRQTYLDIDEVNLRSIKACLMDKKKVKLSSDGNERFTIFDDGLLLSTGLNIMLGKRSSGKTYTLNRIAEAYSGKIKYIKQFELLETGAGTEQFNSQIKISQEQKTKAYLKEFEEIVQDILQMPTQEQDDHDLDTFIKTLKECADTSVTNDVYSRTVLYNESLYHIQAEEPIKKLLDSVIELLENETYNDIISKYITKDQLKSLFSDLYARYELICIKNAIQKETNTIINNIKEALQIQSAAPMVSRIDFYSIAEHHHKRRLFETISSEIKKPRTISKEKVGNFTIDISTHPYANASDMKYGKQISLVDAFNVYKTQSACSFLESLKTAGVDSKVMYTLFAKVEYKILNSSGFPVSGGERSEFNFMQKIKDSQLCDILIIDEPESSFDNVFLNKEINTFLKDMSQRMPVIISTHNNTIGASIKPDYILYTEKHINENKEIEFRIYEGSPTSEYLKTIDGNEIQNYLITIDSLEAGDSAYNERKRIYETLNH